jgi:hypothetical protein
VTGPSLSDLDCETYHAILAVSDVRMAVDFYVNRLGFWLAFSEGTPPTFAGRESGKGPAVSRAWNTESGCCALYFVVGNADELCALHKSRGVEIIELPGDRSYHLRDYTVLDESGYRLTFGHRLRPGSS